MLQHEAVCEGPVNPGCRKQNENDCCGKHQAAWYYGGVTVATVNEGVYQREQDGESVANHPWPDRRVDPRSVAPIVARRSPKGCLPSARP